MWFNNQPYGLPDLSLSAMEEDVVGSQEVLLFTYKVENDTAPLCIWWEI